MVFMVRLSPSLVSFCLNPTSFYHMGSQSGTSLQQDGLGLGFSE